jgi:hypothetical protein
MAIGLISSCKKNNDAASGEVQLLSFGPTGAQIGDTLSFIGRNLNLVTEITFTGNGVVVPQSSFLEQTPELIKVIVPKATEQGFVTLKTPTGNIVTKTKLNLNVASMVSSITRQARPGENITITGNYLNWVTRVTFAKDKNVDSFVSKSIDKLVVTVPKDAQTGPVLVTYSGTKPMQVESIDTLNVTLPMITALSPNPVKQLQDVTITGTNLDLVKQIVFANVSTPVTTFVSQTATQIVVNVPAAANKGKVTLVAFSDVTTTSATDLDIILPVITSMNPNPIKHQENLTITGTNLDLAKQITFPGVTAPVTAFVSQTPTAIVVKVPAAATKGKLSIATASKVATQSPQDLDLILPAVTGMSPNPADPGADLTITGTNLDLVDSITFQNAPAVKSFVSQTASQIVVKVPMGVLRGKVTLSVHNSTVTVQSDILDITGAVPAPTIAFPIYNDAVTTNWTSKGWVGGGWGGTKDLNNTSPIREGSKSIKIDYVGGYGSPFQLGHTAPATLSTSPYTTFKVSIYGAPGSGGKKVNIAINGADKYEITIVEGKWMDYSIPITSLTSTSSISEILIKEFSGTGGFTIYVDALGLN